MTIHAVYTLEELARAWKVKVATVREWILTERKAGRGPTLAEAITKRVWNEREKAFRTCIVLREDYASKLEVRYVFRAFIRRQRGDSLGASNGVLRRGTGVKLT